MNKIRKTNKGLPRRVYIKSGTYYFYPVQPIRDPADGKVKAWIKLCRVSDGEVAMLQALSALLGSKSLDEGSMPHVCAEFAARKLKQYTPDVQAQYRQYLGVIAEDFEEFHAGSVTTKDCADFLRNKFSDKHNTAKKYTALMRKLFKYAISELGLRQDNPIDQIDLSDYKTQRRGILPTHDQVRQIRAAGMIGKVRRDTGKALPTQSGPMFAAIIDMTYLCWARAVDVRMLKETQIDDEWIRLQPSKTLKTSGSAVDIFITPEIREVIERARAIKRQYGIISQYLFPTKKGTPYSKSGLFSMWERARDRLGINKDSPPEERIQFKDLRALGATDAAKSGQQKDEIRKRLVHTTTKTTDIYIKETVPDKSEIDMKLPWKNF